MTLFDSNIISSIFPISQELLTIRVVINANVFLDWVNFS